MNECHQQIGSQFITYVKKNHRFIIIRIICIWIFENQDVLSWPLK